MQSATQDVSKSDLPSACSLCGGRVVPYFAYTQGETSSRGLFRCGDCRLLTTSPLPTEDELAAWYQKYDVLGQTDDYFAWVGTANPHDTPEGRELVERMALVRQHLSGESPRILEVGSGHGFFLSLAKEAGMRPIGVELNATAAQASRERFGVEVRAGTLEATELPKGSFDAVVLWDLIEHVRDPAALLTRVRQLLTPSGLLFIETPNADSALDRAVMGAARLRWPVPARLFYGMHHLTLFNPRNLRRMLQEHGFTLVELHDASTSASRVFRGKSARDRMMRTGVSAIQLAGKLVRRQNKMIAVARRRA
jgi:2-polyprenyl-3-methyl-5-hydroxy-6-metoxy-1,4-benzoquinol methylase